MFHDHSFDHNQSLIRREATVRLTRGEHRGKPQWYAEDVPPEWQGKLATSHPGYRGQFAQRRRGVGGRKVVGASASQQPHSRPAFRQRRPQGSQSWKVCRISLRRGAKLVITDTPENTGTLLRRSGESDGCFVRPCSRHQMARCHFWWHQLSDFAAGKPATCRVTMATRCVWSVFVRPDRFTALVLATGRSKSTASKFRAMSV